MRFFKEALVLVTILFSLSLISFSQAYTGNPQSIPASGIISYSSKPYVDGTVIKDHSGNPVRLQGFNVEPRDMDEEGMQWLKSRGFNYIRITFLWHRFEPQQDRYSSTYFGYLDNLLNLCQEYGIYANLCFMQWQWSPYFTYYLDSEGTGFPEWVISGGGYENSGTGLGECISDFFLSRGHGVWMREKFFEFWTYLIDRYKNNTYLIAYEIINEPTIAKQASLDPGVTDAIMNMYEEFTMQFRNIDPNTIHIYHGCGAERPVAYPNVVWTRSWYNVMYGGYSPNEYSQIVSRLTDLKNKFNDGVGTPFLISEMGFTTSDEASGGAEDWIRDSFDVMREIELNNGYESYGWYIYYRGIKYGFRTPRNSDGSDTWIVPILQEYI